MPPEDFEVAELKPAHKLFIMAGFGMHENILLGGVTDRKPLAYNHICAIQLYELRNDLDYYMNGQQWPEHPTLNAAAARNFYLDHINELMPWIRRHREDKEKISKAMDNLRTEYHAIPEAIIVNYIGLPPFKHF